MCMVIYAYTHRSNQKTTHKPEKRLINGARAGAGTTLSPEFLPRAKCSKPNKYCYYVVAVPPRGLPFQLA